jgi:hypothetical protein
MTYVPTHSTMSRIGNAAIPVESNRFTPVQEKAEYFYEIGTAQKAVILSKMALVDKNSITGYCMDLFVKQAHLKTTQQVMQCVLDLQSQINDNEELMMQILGLQFDFFNKIQFTKVR